MYLLLNLDTTSQYTRHLNYLVNILTNKADIHIKKVLVTSSRVFIYTTTKNTQK